MEQVKFGNFVFFSGIFPPKIKIPEKNEIPELQYFGKERLLSYTSDNSELFDTQYVKIYYIKSLDNPSEKISI